MVYKLNHSVAPAMARSTVQTLDSLGKQTFFRLFFHAAENTCTLLGTRNQAGRHFVPSDGPTRDCEIRLAPHCFSFLKWQIGHKPFLFLPFILTYTYFPFYIIQQNAQAAGNSLKVSAIHQDSRNKRWNS